MLDMETVGLGNLTEYRLLVLFGNYHSLCLVEGTELTPNDIVDEKERLLYPAYYMTHLQVPVGNFVEDYNLWDNAKTTVEIKKFGVNLLDSYYTFHWGTTGSGVSSPARQIPRWRRSCISTPKCTGEFD